MNQVNSTEIHEKFGDFLARLTQGEQTIVIEQEG